MTQYSIEQVQENPDGVIQAVEREKAVEITQYGKQVAVLLSVEEYDRLSQQKLGFAQSLALFRKNITWKKLILTQMKFSKMCAIGLLDVR